MGLLRQSGVSCLAPSLSLLMFLAALMGCSDSDSTSSGTCSDGDTRQGTTVCGLNDEGVLSQRCEAGRFVDAPDDCSGSDVCANGAMEAQECGDGGTQQRLCEGGQWSDWGACEEPIPGCTDPDATNYDPDATVDDGSCDVPLSSDYFIDYAQTQYVPGRFPASPCDDIGTHHECVSAAGCNWLRTIKDNGICREDPVSRCLSAGECRCRAADFHGLESHDPALEVFVPLSIVWSNLAPRTSAFGAGTDKYTTRIEIPEITNESLGNFTSRTDFTQKSLHVEAVSAPQLASLSETNGLSLTLKFMHVWDRDPATMQGTLFDGLGMRVVVTDDQVSLVVGDQSHAITGESDGDIKNYQCNQLGIVVSEDADGVVYLGSSATTIPGLTMETVRNHLAVTDSLQVMTLGNVNAKIWDLRLYGNGRRLSGAQVEAIGKRCGSAGQYRIPDGYPESNTRYSWGMGGSNIVQNHQTQSFSSGVYVTMWIPEDDVFPPTDPEYRDNLKRMIGFWDRWHEQMFFELDMIPFVDTRQLSPEGSLNTYRNYSPGNGLCDEPNCGEPANYNNPCKYVTDLFQGFNWLPENFPGEPTSADHRRIAENGGWTRWDSHDPATYESWQRPVHEHGHTAHFTLMRTYDKVHHYIRGISGESFAEVMSSYVLTGLYSWLNTGLTYYPTIPLTFEGRWDPQLERHVFKSSQPYQEKNIDDQGLGARFYGLNMWWTFVSHYVGKPYLIGRLSADTDQTPGTTLQKTRFYLAQEGVDLGEIFGNYTAHVATWDWPYTGHNHYQQELEPFQGIENWCTVNSGPDCTADGLKVQADVPADTGTGGEWVDGPPLRSPGGFASNTIRIQGAPGGSLYSFGLDFEVPTVLYPDTDYQIALKARCKDDPRFFSSRIVVVDAGTEGQADRPHRPQYYKVPGRHFEEFIVQVPEGQTANIYLLAIPTPPFELEDVPGFVDGYSLIWPYKYKVSRLDSLPAGSQAQAPIILEGDQTLTLTPQEGNGFLYDCFHGP
jgi:hypothetical protein